MARRIAGKVQSLAITATKRASGKPPKRHVMWRAIRILRTFTVGELMAVSEIEHRGSVSAWLHRLKVAGYVRSRLGDPRRHEPARYTLIRDTGPLCPAVVKNGKAIYDFNTQQEISLVSE